MELPGRQPKVCLYCQTYQQISPDYPVNAAVFATDSEIPRCEIHAQYTCHSCDKQLHFNGIAWCHDCQLFSCLHCGGHRMVEQQFFVYDYYYLISCTGCGTQNLSLDYAEVEGQHPFQLGDLRPEEILQVWLPFGQQVPYQPELKQWGNARLLDMSVNNRFIPVEEQAGHSKKVWDANAQTWASLIGQDLNHSELIIPQMLAYLDPQQKQLMDIACGEGNFTRKVQKAGYQVTGTDVSNLLDYALEQEKNNPLGIDYLKISAHDLMDSYATNSFAQVTCNMALMDMDNLPRVLENVAHILQPGGQFVFSITHPVFAWPVARTVRLPSDSQHNEDKGWLVDHYFDEQPTQIEMADMPEPMLYYPRTISTYINTLREHGFELLALAEPRPSEELARKYPRQFFQDYERTPDFMVFQTRLLE